MSADELSTDGMVIVDTRNIALPQGGVLQVEMTQPFVDKLRQHFGLLVEQPLEDDHVRMYIWGAADHAVAKAEQEVARNVAGPDRSAEGVRKPRRRKKGTGG